MTTQKLIPMLHASAVADRERALLSLELLSEHPAGIGDHSTGDFFKNAEEALSLLADAEDRLATLSKYFADEVPRAGAAKLAGGNNERLKSGSKFGVHS